MMQGELFGAAPEPPVMLVKGRSVCPRCRRDGAPCEVEAHLAHRVIRAYCAKCRVYVERQS